MSRAFLFFLFPFFDQNCFIQNNRWCPLWLFQFWEGTLWPLESLRPEQDYQYSLCLSPQQAVRFQRSGGFSVQLGRISTALNPRQISTQKWRFTLPPFQLNSQLSTSPLPQVPPPRAWDATWPRKISLGLVPRTRMAMQPASSRLLQGAATQVLDGRSSPAKAAPISRTYTWRRETLDYDWACQGVFVKKYNAKHSL